MSIPASRALPPSLRWAAAAQQTGKRKVKISMRAEDPSRIWERRAPLTPDAVYALIRSDRAEVDVVSSAKRIFTDAEYVKAGATIVPAITDADIILGIKEPPLSELIALSPSPSKEKPQTHLMFSHTIKGQSYNMPLLSTFLEHGVNANKILHPRLVDYELLTDAKGKRTVGFGWFAGVAGVLESLASMAQSHLGMGVASPFLYTPRPHTLPSISKLRASLHDIGSSIAMHGTPDALGPFIFGLTGNGQVSQGCLSILEELPIRRVGVGELQGLVEAGREGRADLKKIYLVHVQPEDYLIRTDGGAYNREHYYQSPQSYRSEFADRVAPYLTLLLNGIGWSPSFPRLMDNAQLTLAVMKAQQLGGARCLNVGDISCDVEGGLEFMKQATTLSAPFYLERAALPAHLPPVQIMSVDILPASIPLDASIKFSSQLEGYMDNLVGWYYSPSLRAGLGVQGGVKRLGSSQMDVTMDGFPVALDHATVASGGRLKERHQWLGRLVQEWRQGKENVNAGTTMVAGSASGPSATRKNEKQNHNEQEKAATPPARASDHGVLRKKRVLMLGSGMVSGPAVDLIARNPGYELVIASDSAAELHDLAAPHHNVKFELINAMNPRSYAHLIKDSDVVISLLPASMHATIGLMCVRLRKHLVTASYTSPEMRDLHQDAERSDVILLNEIGLDPGIDHCSAMDMIHSLHKDGKTIVSFTSFCGGLPSPEDARVPLGYKFSWRPQGVLMAAMNEAKYLLGNKRVEIPGDSLLQSYFPEIKIEDLKLEGLPNRNSYDYMHQYLPGVKPSPRTFLRGTLRYPGFSSLMQSFKAIGLLETKAKVEVGRWEEFVNACVLRAAGVSAGAVPLGTGVGSLLAKMIPEDKIEELRDALEWFGLAKSDILTDAAVRPMPPLPKGPHTPLDLFAYLLSQKLKYASGERDMVVLAHEIITKTRLPSSSSSSSVQAASYQTEIYTSTLITKATTTHNVGYLGERPASAMARTVGMPVAIAAMLVADGAIKERGVLIPTRKELYAPILTGLREVGVVMKEKSRVLSSFDKRRTVEDEVVFGERMRLERGKGNVWGKERKGGLGEGVYDLDKDTLWKEPEIY